MIVARGLVKKCRIGVIAATPQSQPEPAVILVTLSLPPQIRQDGVPRSVVTEWTLSEIAAARDGLADVLKERMGERVSKDRLPGSNLQSANRLGSCTFC